MPGGAAQFDLGLCRHAADHGDADQCGGADRQGFLEIIQVSDIDRADIRLAYAGAQGQGDRIERRRGIATDIGQFALRRRQFDIERQMHEADAADARHKRRVGIETHLRRADNRLTFGGDSQPGRMIRPFANGQIHFQPRQSRHLRPQIKLHLPVLVGQ